MKNIKKKLLGFLKIFLSIFILVYVFSQVDRASLLRVLKDVDKAYLLLAFFILLFQFVLGVLRWQMLLKTLEFDIPISRLLISFSGSLFFNLLPFVSVIGGDIARGADLSRHTQRAREVIATVFLDRLSGYVGLVILALVAFTLGDIQDASTLYSLLLIVLVLVVIILVLFNKFFYSLVSRFMRSSEPGGIRDSFKNIHHEVHIFKRHKSVIVKNIGVSLLIQVCSPLIWIAVALSLGIKTNLIYFFVFTPIIGAITMLPISVAGGLGIREYFTRLFFTKVGIIANKAVALSLINSIFVIIVGLIGGSIYVLTVHNRRLQHHQPSQVCKSNP